MPTPSDSLFAWISLVGCHYLHHLPRDFTEVFELLMTEKIIKATETQMVVKCILRWTKNQTELAIHGKIMQEMSAMEDIEISHLLNPLTLY